MIYLFLSGTIGLAGILKILFLDFVSSVTNQDVGMITNAFCFVPRTGAEDCILIFFRHYLIPVPITNSPGTS